MTENRSDAGGTASVGTADMKLEVVTIPVSDVDRATEFYVQEVTTRLPGRVDPAATSFGSASDLASAMRRAAAAHGEHEKRIGQADANWPDWYAEYMVAEQAGTELPT
jgi:catechol 2,3-dioxygenase-like lactoylglutathione lyase family enzyme